MKGSPLMQKSKAFALEVIKACKVLREYKSDYQVDKILDGKADAAIKDRAKKARFDERLSLLGLLLDGVTEHLRAVNGTEGALTELLTALKNVRVSLSRPGADAKDTVDKEAKRLHTEIVNGKKASSLSSGAEHAKRGAEKALGELSALLQRESPPPTARPPLRC